MAKIADLAEIQYGYLFRKSIENDPDSEYAVIQIGDLRNYATVDYDNLSSVIGIQPKAHHLIRKDDVLFIAKGTNNFAVHVNKSLSKTVAAANFLIIRVKSITLLPQFLAWYINTKPAQKYLKAHSRGTNAPTISKAALGDLVVHLPPVAIQEKIIRIQALADAESKLVSEIQAKKAQVLEASLLKAISEDVW